MALEKRPEFRQVELLKMRHWHHQVRVAHRNRRAVKITAADQNFVVDEALAFNKHGDVFGGQTGNAHVHPHQPHLALFHGKAQFANARRGFHREFLRAGKLLFIQVFADAANAVAAHFRFRAVGIEDTHPKVGFFRRAHEDEPVPTHAETPVADTHG